LVIAIIGIDILFIISVSYPATNAKKNDGSHKSCRADSNQNCSKRNCWRWWTIWWWITKFVRKRILAVIGVIVILTAKRCACTGTLNTLDSCTILPIRIADHLRALWKLVTCASIVFHPTITSVWNIKFLLNVTVYTVAICISYEKNK